MKKLIEIKEFDFLVSNSVFEAGGRYHYIDQDTFDEIETLILSYNDSSTADTLDFLDISSKRNIGKVICAKNYVGLIQTKSGTMIQIMPKIDLCDIQDTKKIFLKMLRSMKDFPSKALNDANLKLASMDIYEIFIRMYIQEVRHLTKKGIKSAYQPKEENEYFVKGKLLINDHVRLNNIHKERFYVTYDEFVVNRPENRIIKSTLLKLAKLSNSYESVREILQLLVHFEMVEPSTHYTKDLAKVVIDRNTKDYADIIKWSEVFLFDKSFTTFSGTSTARALLFPMEKIFEAYISRNLKKLVNGTDWNISLQDRGYYLFERQFALRPDIVLEKPDNSRRIVLDTKWKSLVNNPRSNYGISQADMYQMYAYAKKYDSQEIWLLYPANSEMRDIESIQFNSDDGITVRLYFVDVADIVNSLNLLLTKLN